jgi:hypothetical protein
MWEGITEDTGVKGNIGGGIGVKDIATEDSGIEGVGVEDTGVKGIVDIGGS